MTVRFSDDVWAEVKGELMTRLEAIAEVLEGKVAKKISHYKPYAIRDTGEFLNRLTHRVKEEKDYITLTVWSDTPHAKYVLGGKVPSYTPLAPLEAWVIRKRLAWTDKKGNTLTALQMAYMIRNKIKREGIKERNVMQEVIKEEIGWIEKQLGLVK